MAKKKEKDNTLIFFLVGAGILAYFLLRKKPAKPVEEILKEVFNNLEFNTNSAIIKHFSFASLDELAEVLKKTNWKLKISGHTDNVGSEDFNLKLSLKRAEAVKNYLISKGVKAENINAIGYGETMPLVDNDTEENRAKNRRVEFAIIKGNLTINTPTN